MADLLLLLSFPVMTSSSSSTAAIDDADDSAAPVRAAAASPSSSSIRSRGSGDRGAETTTAPGVLSEQEEYIEMRLLLVLELQQTQQKVIDGLVSAVAELKGENRSLKQHLLLLEGDGEDGEDTEQEDAGAGAEWNLNMPASLAAGKTQMRSLKREVKALAKDVQQLKKEKEARSFKKPASLSAGKTPWRFLTRKVKTLVKDVKMLKKEKKRVRQALSTAAGYFDTYTQRIERLEREHDFDNAPTDPPTVSHVAPSLVPGIPPQ